MNDARLPDSWWLLSRARGAGLVLRVLILTSTVVAVGCTWLAAGHTVPVVNVVIFGLALVCVVLPDSHVGLLVVLVVGIEWLVDGPRSGDALVGRGSSVARCVPRFDGRRECRPTGCDVDSSDVPPLDAPILGCDGCERWNLGRRSGDPRPSRSEQRGAGYSVLGRDRDRRAMGPRRHVGRRTRPMNWRRRERSAECAALPVACARDCSEGDWAQGQWSRSSTDA